MVDVWYLKSIKMIFYFKQVKLGLIDDNFNRMYINRLTVVIRNAKKSCTMLLIVIRKILRKHGKP